MPVPFGCQYVQERDAEDPGKHASYELRSGQCYQDQVASSSFARQGRYRCQCCFAGKIQRVNSRDGSQLPVTGSSFSASPPMLRFRFLNVFRSNLLHADHSCVRLLVAKRRSASWDEFGHSTSPAILAGLASRRISRCYGALASLGQFCHRAAGKIAQKGRPVLRDLSWASSVRPRRARSMSTIERGYILLKEGQNGILPLPYFT